MKSRKSIRWSTPGWRIGGFLFLALLCVQVLSAVPVYDHVVIVIEENESFAR
jgi:hypothetical protein